MLNSSFDRAHSVLSAPSHFMLSFPPAGTTEEELMTLDMIENCVSIPSAGW